jgi:hypothetical protein
MKLSRLMSAFLLCCLLSSCAEDIPIPSKEGEVVATPKSCEILRSKGQGC